MGVSTTTVLNWMDWGWKHPRKTEAYLRKYCQDLTDDELEHLWQRMRRREGKRQRRLHITDVLSPEPGRR